MARNNCNLQSNNSQADTQVFEDETDELQFHCGLWVVWFVGGGAGGGVGWVMKKAFIQHV